MANRFNWDEELLTKLRQLPPARRAEVEGFIDILLKVDPAAASASSRGGPTEVAPTTAG